MGQQRYEGELNKWNTERGFGFISNSEGGQDIFVHITAFARDGRQPTVGEALTFEVEPDRNGKRSAVRVRRQGEQEPAAANAPKAKRQPRMARSSHSSVGQKLIVLVLLVLAGVFAYSRYANRVTQIEAAAPVAVQSPTPPPLFESKRPAQTSFSCDGRMHCSQMTSCKEAKFFLQNCPDTKMDGNHDGIPCEQQWCTSPFAE